MSLSPLSLLAHHQGRLIPKYTPIRMKVVGVYRHGVTLLGKEREVVYLTWVDKPGPFSIFVPDLERVMERFQNGQEATLTNNSLQFDSAGLVIDLYSSAPFADIPVGILANKNGIRITIEQLAGSAQHMQLSASDCLNAYLATVHQIIMPPTCTQSLASEPLGKLVSGFLFAQKTGNFENQTRISYDLLGLGPGLTPAGDDFLAGWIAARAITYTQSDRDQQFLQDLIEAITHQAPLRTHPLSSALIWAAVQGEIDHTLKQILADILSGRRVQPYQLRQLAETGHSSGLDGLAGALSFLEYFLAQ